MSRELINKYAGVQTVANDELAKSMMKQLVEMNHFGIEMRSALDAVGGDVILQDNKEPEVVLEMTVGQLAEDCALTLYMPHPIFNSRDDLMKARIEVIEGIKRYAPSQVLNEPNRGRKVLLSEIGFAQLLDILKIVTPA